MGARTDRATHADADVDDADDVDARAPIIPRAGEHDAPASALPRELLAAVVASLGILDRCAAAAVCRRWRAAVAEAPPPTKLELVFGEDGRTRASMGRPVDVAAVLPLPLCAGLRNLGLEIVAPGASRSSEAGRAVRRALSAAPVGLSCLEIVLCSEPSAAPPPAALEGAALDAALSPPEFLASRFPSLQELRLLRRPAPRCEPQLEHLEAHIYPHHPKLARLHALCRAPKGPGSGRYLSCLPSLASVASLDLHDCLGATLLARALAARGVAVGELAMAGSNLDAAAARLLRPAAVPGAPAQLNALACNLPDAGTLPPDAFAGLRTLSIEACEVRPASLQWIVGGAHVPTLARLELDACPLEGGLTPQALFSSLQTLPHAVRIRLGFDRSWPLPDFIRALDDLGRDRSQAVRFEIGIDTRFVPAAEEERRAMQAAFERLCAGPPPPPPPPDLKP